MCKKVLGVRWGSPSHAPGEGGGVLLHKLQLCMFGYLFTYDEKIVTKLFNGFYLKNPLQQGRLKE